MTQMNQIPCVGESAPDFKAAAFHEGRQVEITLSRYRGQWVVLIFYPGDFTCVCPTEIAAMSVKYPAFRESGSEVIAVSTDPPDHHRKFAEKEVARMVPGGVRFPLVSDPLGEIGSLYGVYDAVQRVEIRSHFIIDPDGIIQSLEIVAAPLGRSVAEILRQVRALKEHRATGRMTPCGWEPGKTTLPPSDEPGEHKKPWEEWKPRNAF